MGKNKREELFWVPFLSSCSKRCSVARKKGTLKDLAWPQLPQATRGHMAGTRVNHSPAYNARNTLEKSLKLQPEKCQ